MAGRSKGQTHTCPAWGGVCGPGCRMRDLLFGNDDPRLGKGLGVQSLSHCLMLSQRLSTSGPPATVLGIWGYFLIPLGLPGLSKSPCLFQSTSVPFPTRAGVEWDRDKVQEKPRDCWLGTTPPGPFVVPPTWVPLAPWLEPSEGVSHMEKHQSPDLRKGRAEASLRLLPAVLSRNLLAVTPCK